MLRSRLSYHPSRRFIELLYGFSIANDLASATLSTIIALNTGNTAVKVSKSIVVVLVFVLAIGEWLAYHTFVAPYIYRRLSLIVIDMIIPLLLYCIIVTRSVDFKPTIAYSVLTATHHVVEYSAIVILLYFLLALVYATIYWIDDQHNSRLLITSALCCGLSMAAFLFVDVLPSDP